MQAKHYHKLDREIQAMQLMRGPYVAELYCWFQDDDSVWLVMEFCEGGDLFKCLMVHSGRLDESYVCTEVSLEPTNLLGLLVAFSFVL